MQLDNEGWIIRRRGDDEVHALRRHVRPIALERTRHQLVEIVATCRFGKALLLDGVYQSSEFDQLLKHEVLVHPVMSLACGTPTDVLVVGGGEGCVVREVLRHTSVRSVVMVELDDRVPALCETHLGWDEGALRDPKVTVYFGDAAAVLPNLPKSLKFDVIIVDSTQPAQGSLAGSLAEANFLSELRRRLRKNGFVAGYGINAAPIARVLRTKIRERIQRTFGGTLVEYVVPCPFYSASFAFQLCTASQISDLGGLVLERFAELALTGPRALDAVSMRSYLAIPWGYR